MLRISILLQSVASVRVLSTSQSRLQNALDHLDRNPSVDACLDVVRAMPHTTPVDKARLRALADEEEDDAALSTRFFDAKPCDDAVRALARGDDEAAAAVSASGHKSTPRRPTRASKSLRRADATLRQLSSMRSEICAPPARTTQKPLSRSDRAASSAQPSDSNRTVADRISAVAVARSMPARSARGASSAAVKESITHAAPKRFIAIGCVAQRQRQKMH